MGELTRIIDDYRDSHGQPSEASVARALGLSAQAVNSWRSRGVKQLPTKDALTALARLTGLSYEAVVLPAALRDAGYLSPRDERADLLAELTPEQRAEIIAEERREREERLGGREGWNDGHNAM